MRRFRVCFAIEKYSVGLAVGYLNKIEIVFLLEAFRVESLQFF